MELPVKIVPYSGHLENTHYKIKTHNLSYEISPRHGHFHWLATTSNTPKLCVLKNINCEAKPGELTVIAGPSGAGKTTLLEILAGNITRFSGHILVNDNLPINAARFRRLSGYVTQDDALFPHLTVEETLTYRAHLRPGWRPEKAKDRVQNLLEELEIKHIAGARVGSDSKRGISGGEKRRVSIGVELVHDPSVLLLDEPTSGLDSTSALHVMLLLKSMAKNRGKTVVLTLHQPGFRILDLINRALLLANGVVIHDGSLHFLEDRIKSAGHCIPPRVNALEFAIDVAGTLEEIQENDRILIDKEKGENENENEIALSYGNSPSKEALILSRRFCSNVFRTKQLFAAKTIEALLAGVVLGSIYSDTFGSSNKGMNKLQNQLGFIAFSLTLLTSSTTEALPIFLQERRIMMRETSMGVYRVSSYMIANTVVFLPFLLVVSLLYSTPVYWLVGLRRDVDGFLYFCVVIWMVVMMANSFVACFSAIAPDFITGMSLIYGVMGSFFVFSGYFMSKDSIPKYWSFMQYLSLFKYPFECFVINEFVGENSRMRCLEGTETECLIYGNQFLMHQGLKESQKWTNLFVMLGFVFGYRLLGLVFLWYRSYRSRS